MTQASRGQVVVYQGQDGALRIEANMTGDSIWLPMAGIAKLFGVNVPAISKHVKNIYATRELSPRATVSKMETVRREGKRQVVRTVEQYSLDMIISVGYRVNSTKATRFRIWATQTLKEHLTRGYTLNRQRFQGRVKDERVGAVKHWAAEGNIDSLSLTFPCCWLPALKMTKFRPIMPLTTPATPLHGSAPGGLLFSGAGK